MTPNKERAAIIKAVKSTQSECGWIYEDMPRRTQNEAQERLLKLHGSPYQLAKGLVEAIGEISVLEARSAAEKYRREWNASK